MTANYHTHTARCHHASGTEREYIETAIARGLKVLGFSDHSPQFFPTDDYYSHFRMRPEETDGYIKTLTDLRHEYRDDIDIKIGFEIEYYPEIFDKLIEFLKPYNLDYVILGQHFIANEYDTHESSTARNHTNEQLTRYTNQTLEAIKTGKFTYIAHPDVFRFEGDENFYELEARRLCEGAKSYGIPLEVNFLGLAEGRHYPSERFYRIARKIGCDFVFGCDAHEPNAVMNPDTYKKVSEFAARLDIVPTESIALLKI
ncbi:MAG: histidinol-phosphatase [Clostridia bacterium]|nr:histidinol-phosphatase [Clostridia bacterium]